jgi:hypothetical protein
MSAICVAIPPNGDRAFILTDTAFCSPETGSINETAEKAKVIGDRCAIATRGLSDAEWRTERALAAYPDYDAKRDAIRDVMTKDYARELKRFKRLGVLRQRGGWAARIADSSEKVRPIFHTDIVLVGFSQDVKRFRATLATSQAPTPYAPWPFAPAQFDRDLLLPFLDDDERIGAGFVGNHPGSIYRFDWTRTPEILVNLMNAQREKCLVRRRNATTDKEWREPEIIGGEAVLMTLYADGRVEKATVHSWGDEIGKPLVKRAVA